MWTATTSRTNFNPRSPHGERLCASQIVRRARYFNPRSPHGERRKPQRKAPRRLAFQSTLPARGATGKVCADSARYGYFNPRSPHGERLSVIWEEIEEANISIHAPRTGSDTSTVVFICCSSDFNPRSPHGERRPCLRGCPQCRPYFNPRSPHGERRLLPRRAPPFPPISIHAPRTGSDCRPPVPVALQPVFQSTLPARGATTVGFVVQGPVHISIHAPRTGSDALGFRNHFAVCISIHAPRTGSDSASTGSFGRLTISIHAPRTGSDHITSSIANRPRNFNPRSPHGERQRKVTILSIRIIDFAQKVYHKTVLLRISLAENAVILPEKPRNPVRTSLQKAGGLRFARAIRAAHPYSISSPSGA